MKPATFALKPIAISLIGMVLASIAGNALASDMPKRKPGLWEINMNVEGAPSIALSAAFIWGVLSIVLSPCHLLIVGFIDDQDVKSTGRAFTLSLLFSIGILITIAMIGVVTAMAGRMVTDPSKSVS